MLQSLLLSAVLMSALLASAARTLPASRNLQSTDYQSAGASRGAPLDDTSVSLAIQQKLEFFTGLLVLVGFLQACAMVWQAKLLKETQEQIAAQATSMRKQGIEMRSQTVANMNADSAWVSVIPGDWAPSLPRIITNPQIQSAPFLQDSKALRFTVKVTNVGHTPARVLRGYLRYILTQEDPAALSAEPDYGKPVDQPEYFLVPDEIATTYEWLEPGPILSEEEILAVQGAKSFLFAFGSVQYLDVFGRPHETRYAYVYHFPQGGRISYESAAFRRGGPPAYNRAT